MRLLLYIVFIWVALLRTTLATEPSTSATRTAAAMQADATGSSQDARSDDQVADADSDDDDDDDDELVAEHLTAHPLQARTSTAVFVARSNVRHSLRTNRLDRPPRTV